ncbi:unnamed protein product [Trichobilharzia szidati]|nr:unnamed protein product [Trichobilharzia szidati]
MVGVGIKKRNALGRVSIVDYEGELLYDVIVNPEEEITDYRTPWSGIRQEDMSRAIQYSCAREHVKSIIQNRILVGHTLHQDLHVLKLEHPSHLVRDIAAVQYPKSLAGFLVKNAIGLRALTLRLFGVNIQDGEHCSIEDACASMAIYRLVEKVWERDLVKSLKKTNRLQSGTHSHTDSIIESTEAT